MVICIDNDPDFDRQIRDGQQLKEKITQYLYG